MNEAIGTRGRRAACGAVVLAVAGALSTGRRASAATLYNWSSPTAGGNWSANTNWTPTGVPATGDTATLGDATANRTVVYDAAASGALGTLAFSQTDPFVNLLDVQRALTLANGLTLGASGGGTSQVYTDPPSPAGSITFKLTAPSVTLNAGGVLEVSNYKTSASTMVQTNVVGGVAIGGGTFYADRGLSTTGATGNTLTTTVTGTLGMSSGTLSMGNHAAGGNAAASGGTATTDDKLLVTGNLTITGGTFTGGGSVTAGVGSNTFYLQGAANSISGLTGTITPQVVLFQSTTTGQTTQALQSDSALTGGLLLRNSGSGGSITYPVGTVTSGGTLQVGQVSFTNHATGTETLQLTSNVASNFIPNAAGSNAPQPIFAIDANGNTLDLSGAASAAALANYNTATTWSLTNSGGPAAPGAVKARAFDLSAPKAGVTVGSYVNLIATGSGGTTSTLSNATANIANAIDPTSTFTYNGTATASNFDKLAYVNSAGTSGGQIGNVAVSTGALQLATNIATAGTSAVSVSSGATLDLGGFNLSTGSLTSSGKIRGVGSTTQTGGITSSGSIDPGGAGTVGNISLTGGGGALTLGSGNTANFDIASASSFDTIGLNANPIAYDGTLAVNFTYTPANGQQYAIFGGVGAESGNFAAITSNLPAGEGLSFDPASGVLTVVQVVPEPTMCGVAGTGAAALLLRRRRRGRGA